MCSGIETNGRNGGKIIATWWRLLTGTRGTIPMKRAILTFSALAFLLFAASVVHAQAASLSLSFTDNASNETGFDVERCQGSGCSGFAKVAGLGVNVTTYVDSGLLEGTMYCYRVRAVNTGGASAYSNTSCGTTAVAVPAAPSNLLVK